MKILALIIAGSLAVSTAALAQQSAVRGEASVESQTAVSASRRGASVENEVDAQGRLASDSSNGGAAADLAGASQVNATLERSVDARRARPGDEVTAKTSEDFVTQSGVTIPRGTRLVGRVTEAQAHGGGKGSAQGAAGSRLGIVFEKAVLKDGRELPLNVTIQAVAAARSEVQGRLGSANESGALRGSAGSLGGVASAGGRVAGGLAGGAGAVVGGVTGTPGAVAGAAVNGAAGAAAQGGGVLGTSAGAVGGLSSSGRLLAGSRGVFGLRDLEIAAAAAGGARGTLITSASRTVRLDGGTQLLLVGSVAR